MKHFKVVSMLASTLVLAIFFQNCGDVAINNAGENASFASSAASGNICTIEGSQIRTHLKTIYVVDTSGSNLGEDAQAGRPATPGTDVDGDRRYCAIKAHILGSMQSDDIFSGMITFADSPSNILINPPPLAPAPNLFTNNKDIAIFRVDKAHGRGPSACDNTSSTSPQLRNSIVPDTGNTNYIDTLKKINKEIGDDASIHQEGQLISSAYQIFFVSDGAPGKRINRALPPPSTGFEVVFDPQPLSQIETELRSILRLKQSYTGLIDSIQFHTAYYGLPSDNCLAIGITPTTGEVSCPWNVLERMAQIGGGQFRNFSAGSDLSLNDFSSLSRQLRLSFRDLWVLNENILWEDNQLKKDVDGDGLSNEIELSFSSDPNNPDSNFNGVSDGVEARTLGAPCKENNCSLSRPITQCGTPNPTYSDQDNDGLNDCEETLLGSRSNAFDSNGQGLPDYLTFRSGLSMTTAGDLFLDPDRDGLNSYQELKLGLPPLINNSQLVNPLSVDLSVNSAERQGSKNCYELKIHQIPRLELNDRVNLFWIEGTTDVTNKKVLRRAILPSLRSFSEVQTINENLFSQ